MLTETLQAALLLALTVSAPAALAGWLATALVTAARSSLRLDDPSLAHLPRVLAIGVALALTAGWMGAHLVAFATSTFEQLATVAP